MVNDHLSDLKFEFSNSEAEPSHAKPNFRRSQTEAEKIRTRVNRIVSPQRPEAGFPEKTFILLIDRVAHILLLHFTLFQCGR